MSSGRKNATLQRDSDGTDSMARAIVLPSFLSSIRHAEFDLRRTFRPPLSACFRSVFPDFPLVDIPRRLL
jgi:hypothetical protein